MIFWTIPIIASLALGAIFHHLAKAHLIRIGRDGDVYLDRWVLLGRSHIGNGRVFLHYLHRSDQDDHHDHPWPFLSIVLWPGYWEETETCGERRIQWYGPLSILRRPAEWKHRVIIEGPEWKCWTLVFAGKKVRSWGFWCKSGWRPWREHAALEARGVDGCGDE